MPSKRIAIVITGVLIVGCSIVGNEPALECEPPPCPPNANCANLCGQIIQLDIASMQHRNLTRLFNLEAMPEYAPDGAWLAFAAQDSLHGPTFLNVMEVDGSNRRQVTEMGEHGYRLAWSPNGRSLLYVSGSFASDESQLFTVGVDGSDKRNPTDFSIDGDVSPKWSPDGRFIAFARKFEGHNELYIVEADGSGERQLTAMAASIRQLSWSPDSRHIVFSTHLDPDTHLFITDLSGAESRPLTDTRFSRTNQHPAWSPDGGSIAFDVSGLIHTVAPDGTNLRQWTQRATSTVDLSWSPNGRFLTYSDVWKGYDRELFMIDMTTGKALQLTDSPTSEYSWRWSPDGRSIIYNR